MILLFLLASALFVGIYLLVPIKNVSMLYIFCACLGFCSGYWTLFITVAAELFGSNLRATVVTTVPNFVRGSMMPLTYFFIMMKNRVGIISGALVVGLFTYALAIIALFYLEETFKKDIDYDEDPST